jgi:hypothetical protein
MIELFQFATQNPWFSVLAVFASILVIEALGKALGKIAGGRQYERGFKKGVKYASRLRNEEEADGDDDDA